MDDALYGPLAAGSLKDEFVARMEQLILTGALEPGERLLPERELARRFGVSRPVVHEGILVLETRGLVNLRPRHGVVVNDYRRHGTLDLLLTLIRREHHDLGPGLTADLEHFRIRMEQDIVSLICRRRDRMSELETLRRLNRDMADATRPVELAELDFAFHRELALAAPNSLYALLTNTLKPAHMDLLTVFYASPGKKDQVVAYHDRLIEALERGDDEAARSLIERSDSYRGYE